MESTINKVVLSGFAGADVEVKNVSGNQKLARVNLAVNEYFKMHPERKLNGRIGLP